MLDTSLKTTVDHTKTTNSATTTLDIETDSGSIQHIHADALGNFDYTGKARHIIVHAAKTNTVASNSVNLEKKAVFVAKTGLDSAKKSLTVAKTDQSHSVKSSLDILKTLEFVGGFIAVFGAIFLFLTYKARGAADILNEIEKRV